MIFPAGTLKRLYIDRDDFKRRGAKAHPWVVEVHQCGTSLKFRGVGVLILFAQGMFDLTQTPPIWLETFEDVELFEGEPYDKT